MHISGLTLNGFTVHGETKLHFPKRGVVLVTGENGSGKSSIVEGVAFGGYGETLRGTVPGGREATACAVTMEAATETQMVDVQRMRKKDKTTLSWSVAETTAQEFPTTSKAQEKLEEIIGTFEVWHRSHVFSSEDAPRFTRATDKERKLFLEGWAGIGRFDDALSACRLELVQTLQRFEVSQGRAQMLKSELDSNAKRVEDAERTLAGLPPPAPAGGYATVLFNLRHSIKSTETSLRELREEMRKADTAQGTHDGELWALEQRRKRLARPGEKCGECGQPLPDAAAEREKLEQEAAALKQTAEHAKEAGRSELSGLKEQVADDERTLALLRQKEAGASREAGAIDATERTRQVATQTKTTAQKELEAVRVKVEAVLLELPVLSRAVAVLRAAEVVLGLRGVRAALLARLLGGLEAAANAWLPKVAGQKLRLELKPYSEKKTGGVSDSISLQVHGVGGGEGYKATSAGERRRLDVALLLAFAGKGTLFFDEVFDALDSKGLDAIIQVLGELAAERCVVVITHSEELAARVPHAQHWRVAGGHVACS